MRVFTFANLRVRTGLAGRAQVERAAKRVDPAILGRAEEAYDADEAAPKAAPYESGPKGASKSAPKGGKGAAPQGWSGASKGGKGAAPQNWGGGARRESWDAQKPWDAWPKRKGEDSRKPATPPRPVKHQR